MTAKPDKKSLIDEAISASKEKGTDGFDVDSELRDKFDQSATDGLLGKPLVIGGIKIRPFTLASAAMLKEINSPLIQGVPVGSVPNIILEVLKLIVIQSVPVPEALRFIRSPDDLEIAAFNLGEQIPTNKAEKMVGEVLAELQASTETQVTPELPEDMKSSGGKSRGKVSRRHG